MTEPENILQASGEEKDEPSKIDLSDPPPKGRKKRVSFADGKDDGKMDDDDPKSEEEKTIRRNLSSEDEEKRKAARKAAREEAKRKVELIKAGKKKIVSIVEEIVDNKLDEETLKLHCKYLCKQDYDDVNVERSLVNICGYPLCYSNLPKPVKQRYKISLTEHKVYDLSERKLFCSNLCYKASCYLKEQLADEPYWIRVSATNDILIYRETKGALGEEVLMVPRVDLEDSGDDEQQKRSPVKEASSTKKKLTRLKNTFAASPYIQEDQLNEFAESMAQLTIKENYLSEGVISKDSVEKGNISEKTSTADQARSSAPAKPFTGEIIEKNIRSTVPMAAEKVEKKKPDEKRLEQSTSKPIEKKVQERSVNESTLQNVNIVIKSSTKKSLVRRT